MGDVQVKTSKKLKDLFCKGKEITLEYGGDAVSVWIKKLNTIENKMTFEKADAAKARVMAARKVEGSDLFDSIAAEAEEMERDVLVEWLALQAAQKRADAVEAEFRETEGWNKDNYITGLVDAWTDGLRDKYHLGSAEDRDAEAERVFKELKRYDAELLEVQQRELASAKRVVERDDDATLRKKVTDSLLDLRALLAWHDERKFQEVVLSVREIDNHDLLVFSRSELNELEDVVLGSLFAAIEALRVEVLEGKELPDRESSSHSSESSDPQETLVNSGAEAPA